MSSKFQSNRVGQAVAANHYTHAQVAEDELEEMVSSDIEALGQSEEEFRFFLVFAAEVIDRCGRLLCFINRDQPDVNHPEPRPSSYNERLLEGGYVASYFIWPNINPFRRHVSLVDAVLDPGTANDLADSDQLLRRAREWTANARQQGIGIFGQTEPLKLMPFEIRYLARRKPPCR